MNHHIDNTKELPSLLTLQSIAHEERVERKLNPSQILFIAIAWTRVAALRLFMLCPDVVWCDVTSHSNNKGFCLLTFSCRTSVGKQVIFLWIWIPNEKRFSFRWVFQHAIPILIPISIRKRVSFIMKDGDSQQRNEILKATLNIFPNAIEGSCGWHIGKNSLGLYYISIHTISHNNFLFQWGRDGNSMSRLQFSKKIPDKMKHGQELFVKCNHGAIVG